MKEESTVNAIVKHTGQTGLIINEGPTVLGERQVRIPVGGKIRPGIKVLTAAGKGLKGAQATYDRGVAQGWTWDQIEKAIKDANPSVQRSPLTPKNVPYFTVRRADFSMPEVADKIMQRYAEDRGDGLHLYRFPVILITDAWMTNLPHGFKCHTRSELVYWSEYGPDGTRYCKTRAEVKMDPKAKRATRPFGGRPVVLRVENDGRCDPDRCPQYQSRQCNLSGSLLFYVPGIPGSSAVELPTTSFYSLQQMRQQQEMVAFLRGGRLSGTIDGRPVFWLTKRQDEVSMIDPETGKAKRVKQYMTYLEADLPMDRLFAAQEAPHALEAGSRAAQALSHHEPEFDHDPESEPESEITDDTETGAMEAEPVQGAETDEPESSPEEVARIREARKNVLTLVEDCGISTDVFARYAREKWGDEWSTTLATLDEAAEELRAATKRLGSYLEETGMDVPF